MMQGNRVQRILFDARKGNIAHDGKEDVRNEGLTETSTLKRG